MKAKCGLVSIIVVVICPLLLVSASHADDSPIQFDNDYNVYPIKTEKIKMVSERVVVLRKNISIADVSCEFVFENLTDEEIVIPVGFPTAEFGEKDNLPDQHVISLKDFKSYVDGKEVPVKREKEVIDAQGDRYRYWYVWDVTFLPRQKIVISNIYRTYLTMGNGGHYSFNYILRTGANWEGAIGSAVIEVAYESKPLFRRVMAASPDGFRVDGNRIIWEFKDLIPLEDISISESSDLNLQYRLSGFYEFFDNKEYEAAQRLYSEADMQLPGALRGEIEAIANKIASNQIRYGSRYHFETPENFRNEAFRYFVKMLRNEIYARHGMVFFYNSGIIFYGYDGKISWYKSNPSYSDNDLNDLEKANIKFIAEYEEQHGWR